MQLIAEEAKMSGQVILLLDEIHRLDKGKQDSFCRILRKVALYSSVQRQVILIMRLIQPFAVELKFSNCTHTVIMK